MSNPDTNITPPAQDGITFTIFGHPIATLNGTSQGGLSLQGTDETAGLFEPINLFESLGITELAVEQAKRTALKYTVLIVVVIMLILIAVLSLKTFVEK